MKLSKQRTQSKVEYFIKVDDSSLQTPMAHFDKKSYKYLELFFNNGEERLNVNFFENIKARVSDLNEQYLTVRISEDDIKTLNNHVELSKNILDSQIRYVFNREKTMQINGSLFLLELVKYFNEVRLFSIFGSLDSLFPEIRIVKEDQVSIVIRKNKTLVTGYFTNEEPLLIDTTEVLDYFKTWCNFVTKWQTNKIEGRSFFKHK